MTHRPVPALPWLVAVLALLLAASSSAVAAPTLAKAITKKQATKIAKKEANKAIDARQGSLTVESAERATTATTATNATSATRAKDADHATRADTAGIGLSPVAYAVVNADGTVVAGSTHGLTQAQVVQRDVAAYCFDAPFEFTTVQTTPVHTGPGTDVSAKVGIRNVIGVVAECTVGEEVEVATTVNGVFTKAPFIIWFYD